MVKEFKKEYLGDSVYVDVQLGQMILTTENGEPQPSNTIYLEPAVIFQLIEYLKRYEIIRSGG